MRHQGAHFRLCPSVAAPFSGTRYLVYTKVCEDANLAFTLPRNCMVCRFAWTDLLRTQLSFTRHYVEASRKLATIAAQAGSEYRYTTLDDTRQFIEQNEREIITYEQALCQVQAEQTR